MLERECSRVARSYLYHMCENLGKYQQFLVDFEEKCGLALQKCVKYDAVSTQMGQLTMTDISHNWHTNAGALASDFPEIDQLPDHPDRQVLFVDDRVRRKANGTKAGESASIYGAATAEYYAKLRRAYARRRAHTEDCTSSVHLTVIPPSTSPPAAVTTTTIFIDRERN